MAQQIIVGLIAAMAVLAGSILTLVGVLWKTSTDFKLGKRTGDIAQQTADDSRANSLAKENKELREEIGKGQKEAWDTAQALRHTITEHEETIAGLTAQLNAALRGQERAEGGMMGAEKALQAMRLSSEVSPPTLLLPPLLSLPNPEHRQEEP